MLRRKKKSNRISVTTRSSRALDWFSPGVQAKNNDIEERRKKGLGKSLIRLSYEDVKFKMGNRGLDKS